MILLIDNYDSFTYNIYQYLRELGREVQVARNDCIGIQEIGMLKPSGILLSPGPGRPEEAGISVQLVREFAGSIPIMGICLGHQCIAAAYGGDVRRAHRPSHGRISMISHDGKGVFQGVKNPFNATRYHSLTVEENSLPDVLEVTARSEDGEIMGLRHRLFSVSGLQFHPESVGSEEGRRILSNFACSRRTESAVRMAIRRVTSGEFLCEEEASRAMEEITSGSASPAQISCLLSALSMRSESVEELTGFARVLRARASRAGRPEGVRVVDTCGTGGDGSGTFNVSTVAALVAAGAGVCVAKHGNRSVTSRCGSADVLEALGVNVNASGEIMERALKELGIAFLFAPGYHGSMKYAVPVRREIGIRTAFNVLGPLANPARADSQVIGVYSRNLLEKVAGVLSELGTPRSIVVHGCDGMDEITLTGPTEVVEVSERWKRRGTIDPAKLGMAYCSAGDLRGGDPCRNAEIALSILSGDRGPKRDVVLLNASAAIVAGGAADDFTDGLHLAASSIDSGAAMGKLEGLIRIAGCADEVCS